MPKVEDHRESARQEDHGDESLESDTKSFGETYLTKMRDQHPEVFQEMRDSATGQPLQHDKLSWITQPAADQELYLIPTSAAAKIYLTFRETAPTTPIFRRRPQTSLRKPDRNPDQPNPGSHHLLRTKSPAPRPHSRLPNPFSTNIITG